MACCSHLGRDGAARTPGSAHGGCSLLGLTASFGASEGPGGPACGIHSGLCSTLLPLSAGPQCAPWIRPHTLLPVALASPPPRNHPGCAGLGNTCWAFSWCFDLSHGLTLQHQEPKARAVVEAAKREWDFLTLFLSFTQLAVVSARLRHPPEALRLLPPSFLTPVTVTMGNVWHFHHQNKSSLGLGLGSVLVNFSTAVTQKHNENSIKEEKFLWG